MKVTLIDCNQNAIDKLIFCKHTRLKMSADNFESIKSMTSAEQIAELNYISNTIKSSWEFLDYTFLIEGVSRAFTHQFVRNRQGSYAQQTMRILDVSGFEYVTGPTIKTEEQMELYHGTMATINAAYDELIESGVSIEDARGILPTNICTNIVAKFNLRTLSDMMASRQSPRTQGEYRDVIELMFEAMAEEHPWIGIFLRDDKYQAIKSLQSTIDDVFDGTEAYTDIVKQLDILRNSK